MQTIYTIGTQGMTDDRFLAMLKEHGVDAVIDIRLRNEGRYYRFASGKHIKALCEANGIAYSHDTRFPENQPVSPEHIVTLRRGLAKGQVREFKD